MRETSIIVFSTVSSALPTLKSIRGGSGDVEKPKGAKLVPRNRLPNERSDGEVKRKESDAYEKRNEYAGLDSVIDEEHPTYSRRHTAYSKVKCSM
eukprot:299191-Prymnesium_polylepis.1